jgi:hypothetical protein
LSPSVPDLERSLQSSPSWRVVNRSRGIAWRPTTVVKPPAAPFTIHDSVGDMNRERREDGHF